MIDAVVTGRGLEALLAALDLVEVGLSVVVATDARGEESGWEPVHDPQGCVSEALRRIAAPIEAASDSVLEGALPVQIPPVAPMLQSASGEWAPQATPEVLGIPAVPLDRRTIGLIGVGGAFRAYLDRITPLLTVGKTRELGRLVGKRLGKRAARLLVEPQVRERFGVGSDAVEVAIAAPGLNEALSRAGSLTGAAYAYSDRNVARETRVTPAGGRAAMIAALVHRLELYGVVFVGAEVRAAAPSSTGWSLSMSDGQTIEARALIVDHARSTARTQVIDQLFPTVLPAKHRMYASIDICAPAWLPEASAAVRTLGEWSMLIQARSNGSARVVLASPASAEPPSSDAQNSHWDSLLADSGLRRPESTEWVVRIAAAPYVSVRERERAADELERAAIAQPTAALVGRAVHGDDLGAALAHAHSAAVGLRRRLLGLAD